MPNRPYPLGVKDRAEDEPLTLLLTLSLITKCLVTILSFAPTDVTDTLATSLQSAPVPQRVEKTVTK